MKEMQHWMPSYNLLRISYCFPTVINNRTILKRQLVEATNQVTKLIDTGFNINQKFRRKLKLDKEQKQGLE